MAAWRGSIPVPVPAYTYVGQEIHPALGYITGWSMVMDYLLNPLICTAFSAKAAMNIVPGLPFYAWLVVFAGFFTWVNLHGIRTSAKLNEILCVAWCWWWCCSSPRR